MRKRKTEGQYGNSVLIAIVVLVVCLWAFFLLNRIYAAYAAKPQTVVLDQRLFEGPAKTQSELDLRIQKVTKKDLPGYILRAGVVHSNRLALVNMYDNNPENSAVNLYNLDDNTLAEVASGYSDYLFVTPDGTKLLYSRGNGPRDYTTLMVDLPASQHLPEDLHPTAFKGLALQLLQDGQQLVTLQNSSLLLQNIVTGDAKPLFDIEQIPHMTRVPAKQSDSLNYLLKSTLIGNFNLSPDGKTLYFSGYSDRGQTDKMAVYRLDLQGGHLPEPVIDGSVSAFYPLDNGDLLLNGRFNDETGLFLYHTDSGKIVSLVTGQISSVSLTADGRLAYILENGTQSELHAAYFQNGTIRNDNTVYTDWKYVDYLKWSPDGSALFCISSGIDSSSVFRFDF